MEENNYKAPDVAKNEKLSYEQLEKVALQLQKRAVEAENKLIGIDFAMTRLTWLFKVLENQESFTTKFTTKCAEEIMNLLTLEESTENKETKKD